MLPREAMLPAYDFYPMADANPWTGCWEWKGKINKGGYGVVYIPGGERTITVLAHRIAMYIKHGEMPEGMVVDHKCHVDAIEAGTCAGGDSCAHRRCVNPDHLRFLTAEENRRYRTFPQTVKKRNQETCKSGRHPWIEDNIINTPFVQNGRMQDALRCYQCHRETKNRLQRADRAKAKGDR